MSIFGNGEQKIIAPEIEFYRKKGPHRDGIEFGLCVNGEFQKESTPHEPLVSVITVVRNGELTIERTVQSVLNQTYQNIEYIIIDGGSSDNTLSLIKKYEKKIAYCKSEPDLGIADAFNKGISLASGKLIGIINADDWYSLDAVEAVVEAYRFHGDSIYHGKLEYWTFEMKPYYVFSARDDKLMNFMSINHPTVFVPKSIYEEIGLFCLDFKVAMDYEWIRRAAISGKKFKFINRIISNMSLLGASDKFWWKGYCESFKIRKYQGMNFLLNYFILFKFLLSTSLRKLMETIGLTKFVGFYRKNFSVIKKDAA